MIKKLFIVNVIYLLLGFVFYYCRNLIPIETTSNTIKKLYIISLFLSSITAGYLYSVIFNIPKKTIKYIVSLSFLFLVVHNFLWTILLFKFNGQYEDIEMTYPDPDNKNHKIIEQYMDEGAYGSHHRKVEVYEVFPGFRYVKDQVKNK